jgi:glutathione S-transferase
VAGVITLYDAERCPYCARVRIALAEKGIEHEVVAIDLSDRPAWLYEKNPLGKVPVIEEDTFVLPESAVIMEYLDERYPEPRCCRPTRRRAGSRGCRSGASTICSATTTTPIAAATEPARGAPGRARPRAPAVRRHRLRPVGDPGEAHARRRPAGAPRGVARARGERPSVAAELEIVAALAT